MLKSIVALFTILLFLPLGTEAREMPNEINEHKFAKIKKKDQNYRCHYIKNMIRAGETIYFA